MRYKTVLAFFLLAALAAVILAGCKQDLTQFTQSDASALMAADTFIDYGHWGALYPHEYDLHKALVYAIQDEDKAQAEYEYVNRAFGNPMPLRGIVRSEGMHISALTNLFDQRGWPVPTNTALRYVVTVNTLREAYGVGVSAEETNIAMYNLFLSRPDLPSDFRTVFTNLRDESICHLNAFRRHQGDRKR